MKLIKAVSVIALVAMQGLCAQDIFEQRSIAVIGTGYVGLISGAGLAHFGHDVVCVDIDAHKIARLQDGEIPIFEPGISELVHETVQAKKLRFSSEIGKEIEQASIIIIAVGTPMGSNGQADLSALQAVARTISRHLNSYKVICIKSTVPVGTNQWLKKLLEESVGNAQLFDVVSNPEFLREGSALADFLHKNPIILGSDSEQALAIMANMYQPLTHNGTLMIKADFATSETIKYAWNTFSATRIGFVNELAHFCDAVGADIATVILGMSLSENMLPTHVLRPGPGMGGSCLPKDTRAFVEMAQLYNVDLSIVRAIIASNEKQIGLIVERLKKMVAGSFAGKKIAVLGLSFKANTDDIRYSPAIGAIASLVQDGADVVAYDPQAMEHMRKIFPQISYVASAYDAVHGADAILLLTEWSEFKELSLTRVAQLMNNRIIMDARNLWDPAQLRECGFVYENLGRRDPIINKPTASVAKRSRTLSPEEAEWKAILAECDAIIC